MAQEDSSTSLYRVLLSRFLELELSHAKLTDQLEVLVKKKEMEEQRRRREDKRFANCGGEGRWDLFPGFHSAMGPHCKVLQSMGHAVHVCRAFDGKIIFWNRSAENLYGWKEYEALGQKATELITDEQYHSSIEKIMESLITGQSWSGQFPFKKRSGEIFTALVTKSPLYEDGELVGVITVSSDASVFNIINSEVLRTCQDKERKVNMKKIQWNTKPQIASVSQISSSVSSLASKVFSLRRSGDDDACSTCTSNREREDKSLDSESAESEKESSHTRRMYLGKKIIDGHSSSKEESILGFVQPSKLAAKVREKLNIGGSGNSVEGERDFLSPTHSIDIPVKDTSRNGWDPAGAGKGTCLNYHKRGTVLIDADANQMNTVITNRDEFNVNGQGIHSMFKKEVTAGNENPFVTSWLEHYECPETFEAEASNQKLQVSRSPTLSSPAVSDSSQENLSSKGDKESESIDECEILWDDLILREEIGQGSFAVVYRGFWNGSDVAVKVYSDNEYRESTLQDYKKEIAIMKRLRHPNVLLFMGAAYSPQQLAIVTEFLPRGSLFKTLHRTNQGLDIRRRLRMSLDVVRGMNYLHRRNPPIVHRDLKSSNLLVDRNWTVKVGDFGLSKWKNATYVTAKSGRGTPQWMAPEVLLNEPSNEKSDVFSFGVILWELLTESVPWTDLNSLQVVGVVGFMDRRLDVPESLDPRLASMIKDCWRSDPESRPSFQELIQRMTELIRTLPAGTARTNSEIQEP